MTKFRTAYDEDYDNSVYKTLNDKPSMTQQHFKDACDINQILANSVPGMMPELPGPPPFYADVSMVRDYRSALSMIDQVTEYFSTLPAEVRSRLANDPEQYLAVMSEPDRRAEAEALGLLQPLVAAAPGAEEAPTGAEPGADTPRRSGFGPVVT